jgi:peptide/nickel transport system substrate-binding protein
MKSKKLVTIIMLVIMLTLSMSAFTTANAAKTNFLTIMSEESNGWVQNFNPNINNARHAALGFMFEPLIIFDSFNNNKETPWLAERLVTEPDYKTLTIYVRKGVKWSDGKDFTANDVAFTYNYPKTHPEIDRTGWWDHPGSATPGKIASVKVVDKYTVKIVMKEANRFWRNTIPFQVWMLPEHIYSKVNDPATYVDKNPVVTGAFSKVKYFTPEMIVLGRNQYYWNAKNLKVDELRFPQFNGNQAALSLLQTGAIDWAHIFIPDAAKNYVQGDPDRKFWYGKNDGVRLAFNFMDENADTLKAFKDVNFRRAVSLCVDRIGINKSAVFGYLSKDVPPVTGLPPALLGYADVSAQAELTKYIKYDINAAKKILADAGYKDVDKDGFLENPDGSKLAFEITSPAGWTDWNDGAAIVAQGLKKAGINATAKAIDLAMVIESWKSGKHDILYCGYGISGDPYKFYYDTIGDQSRVKTDTWWTITDTNYVNDEMTALIASMPTAKDAQLKQITAKIEQHFANNMINVPIFYNGNWVVYNTSRFTGWATADNVICNPACVQHDSKLLQLFALKPVK